MACPKCGGATVVGHIPDATHGGNLITSWFPGMPEKSFWRGFKVDETKRMPITAERCVACGFLELFARPI